MPVKKSKKRLWIIVGILVIVLLIIIAVVVKNSRNDGIRVTSEKVMKRTITQTVSANGKIQPEKDVKISPYISGEVVELLVKEGEEVKAGDLLAKIDPEIYVSAYDQSNASMNTQKANEANARARLAQVTAQYDNAKLTFDRQDKLFKQNVISQSEYDQAKSAYQVAKSQVDAANQDIKASEYMVKS